MDSDLFPSSALDGAAKRIQPMVRKHVDDVYEAIMDSVQDYLIENAEFNIRSRLNTAEREALSARNKIAEMEREKDALLGAISAVLLWRVGDLPDKGYIKDVDPSRAAIGRLAVLHAEVRATGAAS